MSYTGKYPNRIRAVYSAMDREQRVLGVETNGGARFFMSVSGPLIGDDCEDWLYAMRPMNSAACALVLAP